MNEPPRRTPDEILAAVQREGQGQLRVYLGAAPGVGKTYTMLQDARLQKTAGLDVVVGVVDTHKRADTAALLDGLEQIPPRRVEYRGIWVEELDVAAVLARRPEVVLIDELAHSNIPGSPHPKRYEDVEDILEQGIDALPKSTTIRQMLQEIKE